MSGLPVFMSSQAYFGSGTHLAASSAQSACLQLSDYCLTHITRSSKTQLGTGFDTMCFMSKGCMVVHAECCYTRIGSSALT